jgi:hypothetical protein
MKTPTPNELYIKYTGIEQSVDHPYRLFDLKEIIDSIFTYYQEMKNNQKLVETKKDQEINDQRFDPLLKNLLDRTASSVEMYEKTATMRKFIEGRFFSGKVLVKIDPQHFNNSGRFPQWWNGEPVAICANLEEEVMAFTFFNTYDFTMREHMKMLAATNKVAGENNVQQAT